MPLDSQTFCGMIAVPFSVLCYIFGVSLMSTRIFVICLKKVVQVTAIQRSLTIAVPFIVPGFA